MEMHDVLPAIVKALMIIALCGLFLLMLLADKTRLNSKERGRKNLVIALGSSLVATLVFSIIAIFLLYDNIASSLGSMLLPAGFQVFAVLALFAFVPAIIACGKIAVLLMRRKQNHA